MRLHYISNVNLALEVFSKSNFNSTDIQAENIVDGIKNLTLGLVWRIILKFQVISVLVVKINHLL